MHATIFLAGASDLWVENGVVREGSKVSERVSSVGLGRGIVCKIGKDRSFAKGACGGSGARKGLRQFADGGTADLFLLDTSRNVCNRTFFATERRSKLIYAQQPIVFWGRPLLEARLVIAHGTEAHGSKLRFHC